MNNLKTRTIILIFSLIIISIAGLNLFLSVDGLDNIEIEKMNFLTEEEALACLNEKIHDVIVRESFIDFEICLVYNDYLRFLVLEESQEGIKIKKYSGKLASYNWENNESAFSSSFDYDNKSMNITIQKNDFEPAIANANCIELQNGYSLYYYIE